MSVIGSSTLAGASGSAGGDKVYVDDVFSTFLYDGNEGSNQINNGIDLAGEGGLVWFKNRTRSGDAPTLIDTETQSGGYLISNGTAAITGPQPFSSFNSNGYTINSGYFYVNDSSHRYASWTFRKAPGFFDVVTYTGNDVVGRQIAHNLGSVPGMIIVKAYSNSSESWHVYHRSLGNTKYLLLNSTNAENTGVTVWNSTTPTSTHFTVANNNGTNGFYNYVAYIFAHDDAQYGTDSDESIIKCGSYTGNGTAGRTVDLGFEPQWFLVKRSDSSDDWRIFDSMRSFANGVDNQPLYANTTAGEGDNNNIGATATGVVINETNYANANGGTYIYMAIRRPHKPPEAATDVFAIDTYTGSIPNYISGFPVDFVINRDGISGGGDVTVFSRLIGTKRLKTNSTEADGNAFAAAEMDYNNGYASGTGTNPNNDNYSWMFKRAPGFMDVVTYSGTASNLNVSHNLGVAPEFLIVKRRSAAEDWTCYHSSLGNTKYITLNSSSVAGSLSTGWNNTDPTSTVFTVGTHSRTNGSGQTYIALLFATLPGISKVGSYSGTGNDINVDCGFTSGARFVLIKRSDTEISGATGTNWYFWDSTRGIVSGNDPYLLLNRDNNGTDAQVTNTDYIDPLNAGFKITSSASAALNASGGTYLFLAIA